MGCDRRREGANYDPRLRWAPSRLEWRRVSVIRATARNAKQRLEQGSRHPKRWGRSVPKAGQPDRMVAWPACPGRGAGEGRCVMSESVIAKREARRAAPHAVTENILAV
jgi:hypothetical protein